MTFPMPKALARPDAWTELRERRLAKASSIGALFEELDEQLLDELYGADISLSKA